MEQPTDKPFGEAMADLLRENDYTTSTGNPNWHAFAAMLKDVHYETLRKAVAGEREPSMHVMEEVARALRVKPEHFAEYRILKVAESFDIRKVGFEKAQANATAWALQQIAAAPRRRRRT
jgi:hypothetical protein